MRLQQPRRRVRRVRRVATILVRVVAVGRRLVDHFLVKGQLLVALLQEFGFEEDDLDEDNTSAVELAQRRRAASNKDEHHPAMHNFGVIGA